VVIRLHVEGWSITSIAEYLHTTRPTIYETLRRWAEEGVAGLDARPKTNKGVRKVTLQVRNEIRKLQQNPLLGEFRVHTALLRMGIEVSPATCGRIMAANRELYGLEQLKHEGRAALPMPFKAGRRHLSFEFPSFLPEKGSSMNRNSSRLSLLPLMTSACTWTHGLYSLDVFSSFYVNASINCIG
jgi:hypothetical protein